jgi:hypothetical protein
MRHREAVTAGLVALGALLAPVAARADMGPTVEVTDLTAEQIGQDVKVTFGIVYAQGVDVTREDQRTSESVAVCPDGSGRLRLTGIEHLPGCSYWEADGKSVPASEFCAAYPGECADCDGDGAVECVPEPGPTWDGGVGPDGGLPDAACDSCGDSAYLDSSDCADHPAFCVDCYGGPEPDCLCGCKNLERYECTDVCVPPGGYVYWAGSMGTADSSSVTVADKSYEACREDDAVDAGHDPASEGGLGAGCSVSGLGSSGGQGALLALMLGIGLAALRARG